MNGKEFLQKNYLMRWKSVPLDTNIFFSEGDLKLSLLKNKTIEFEDDLENRIDDQPGNFKIYFIQSKSKQFKWDVAFECPNCSKIHLGPPNLNIDSLHCKSCNSRIGQFTRM